RDDPVPREKLRNKRDPLDVLIAVLLGEAEIRGQVRPHLISIQEFDRSPGGTEPLDEDIRQSGFAGYRQTREPKCYAFILHRKTSLRVYGRGRTEIRSENSGI